jgi:NADH:ubiquinone oxidoreductase subunit
MDLISKIFIKLSCNKVGTDEFGNSYFEAKKSKNGHKKRFVTYKGVAEPSKIPAEWHLWMHYSSDIIPVDINAHQFSWQKIHLPNLTGTKFAYFPSGSSKAGGKRHKVSSDYKPWQPN